MYKVYSVESRKGGVGKTTVALNLAKALADQGNNVLLIDCDITGTPITEAASHSPFWKNIVKPIKLNETEFNLIQYFEDVYLKDIGLQKELIDGIKIYKGKVHLIGSEIHDKNGNLIIDPRLLMDDLHTHWFVEMLQEIADVFSNTTKLGKCVIILDNSPGYVGIGKSIREWLTSLGYDYTRFVLVSSLDEQDIESTISSAVDIERMMKTKWELAFQYNKLVKGKGDFYEINKILDDYPGFKSFFFELKEDYMYPTNLKKKPTLKDYVSVVLNKVPNIYHNENIGYKFTDGGVAERKTVIDNLFPLNSKGMPMNTIEYDLSISGQFVESNITLCATNDEKNKTIDKAFNTFNQKIDSYSESEDKVKNSGALYKSFKTFKKDLITMGYNPLAESLGEDLISQNYIQELILFVRSLGNIAIPEVASINVDRETTLNDDKQLLVNFIKKYRLQNYSSIWYSLFDNIYKKSGFKRKTANKYLLINVSLLFRAFLEVQKAQIKDKKNYYYLLMEGYNNASISKNLLNNLHLKRIFKDYHPTLLNSVVENLFYNYFVDFYQKMCYTLLRLIDCTRDYLIIINVCRATIERGGRSMDTDIRNYVRSVVSKKSLEYNENEFNEMLIKPFEMKIIKDMLTELVLKND